MSILQDILNVLATQAIEGATGKQLDKTAADLLKFYKVESAFLNYKPGATASAEGEGFPNVLCVSINNEVIHGIPDDRKFSWGDVVKLDLGLKDAEGNFDDGALTVIVGDRAGSANARKVVKATREALEAGIAQAKVGNTTHDIAKAIQAVAEKYGVAIIEGYGGHGIGKELHQAPDVPNKPVGNPVKLEAGIRLALEPMFATNRGETFVTKDGWTVKVKSGLTAHFERTVTIE